VAAAAALFRVLAPGAMDREVRRVSAFWAASGAVVILVASALQGPYVSRITETMLPTVRELAPNGTISALTAHVWVGFPLANEADMRWGSRFPSLWLLPGVVRGLADPDLPEEAATALRTIERYAIDATVEDMTSMPSDLVVVDVNNPYFGRDGFDLVAYLSRDPGFASIWGDYRKVAVFDFSAGEDVRTFELWQRTVDASDASRRGEAVSPRRRPAARRRRPPRARPAD
jgi:hypothetical protein